jgi:hypothetical protein
MGPSFWNIVFIIHPENAGNDRLNITLHDADYRLPQIHWIITQKPNMPQVSKVNKLNAFQTCRGIKRKRRIRWQKYWCLNITLHHTFFFLSKISNMEFRVINWQKMCSKLNKPCNLISFVLDLLMFYIRKCTKCPFVHTCWPQILCLIRHMLE